MRFDRKYSGYKPKYIGTLYIGHVTSNTIGIQIE